MSADKAGLAARIETAYERQGHALGWRFLYSPEAVLDGAPCAFIGLNPGGTKAQAGQGAFAMAEGQSAYVHEAWARHPAGKSPLQIQVRALFERLGALPPQVLAGNLVPFRSPSWETLEHRNEALGFGMDLWRDVLIRARPKTIVTMGGVAIKAVSQLIRVKHVERIPLCWGNVTAAVGHGSVGEGPDATACRFIGLPHLSRYRIMTRPQSAPALATLF